MKLNVTQPVKDLNNNDIVDENKNTVPVRKFLVDSLNAYFDDERNLEGSERYKRGKLAYHIQNNDEVEITAEETALLKKLIGKGYLSHTVFYIWNMLEGSM
jgi:hypothetical protein